MNTFELTPLPAKAIFKEHRVPLNRVAVYLKISYTHCLNIMNGVSKPSAEIQDRIRKAVHSLESKRKSK